MCPGGDLVLSMSGSRSGELLNQRSWRFVAIQGVLVDRSRSKAYASNFFYRIANIKLTFTEIFKQTKSKCSNQHETKAKQGCQSVNSHYETVNNHSEHACGSFAISYMCKWCDGVSEKFTTCSSLFKSIDNHTVPRLGVTPS